MGFIRLFRWLRGYVLVASNDENVAQFINFLLKSKVKIWDIKKKREYTSFKMFSKDYRRIRKIRHSSKIRIKLKHIGFWGLIRKFNTLIKRKSLLVGFVIYILFLMVMNMFIWNIEIVGNSKINDDIIIGAYTELGVRAGMPKYKIDTYSLKEKLPMKILDVSWCSFNVEGTKLTINITEVSEIDKSNKKIYSNIVASTDGIVKEIDIISGNKSIDVGDVVTKGEVLVSGAPELNSQKFTFSKADIFAQTFKEININIPKMKTYHIRTGKSSSKSIISIFGFKLPLFLDKPHFESSVKRRDKVLKIDNKSLPIKIITKEFFETKNINENLNRDNADNEAVSLLIKEIKKYKIKDVEILSCEISEDTNECVYKFRIKCLENISEIKQIHVSS